ncbi:MAG: phosphatidylserine decarboxylase family protein [Ignavibacteriae bacterium]|nr:MAG: phosphatidylserine decarboxylase family protein [Ignavibacteriota bacterium]
MITKYGYDVFFTIAAVCLVIILLALLFVEPKSYRYSLIVVSFAVLGFVTNFFRDPERRTPNGKHLIIAPADGKVVVIKQVQENEFFHEKVWQVSIFMSPLNVHVNRNPVSGVVKHTRYVKGEFFAAFEDKASEKNEQMIVGIENAEGKVMMKQIAGFIARRIVCPLKPGDTLHAGERFGMIKFGSRVDVFLPLTVEVKTKTGDVTVAGETILGEFPGLRMEN